MSKDTAMKTTPASPLTADQAYAKHKAAFVEEWNFMSERSNTPLVMHKPAKKIRLRFKHNIDDPCGQTETIWSQYLVLRSEDKWETAPGPKTGSSGPQKDDSALPKTNLSKMNTNGSNMKPTNTSRHKQPTVESEPPSPRPNNNPDMHIQPILSPILSPNSSSPHPGIPSPAKSPKAPAGMSGIKYEMVKGRFEIDWDVQKRKHRCRDYPTLAKATQKPIEEAAGNTARSRTQYMPWAKYLNTEKAPLWPPSPTVSHEPSTESKRPRAQKSKLDKLKAKIETDWLLMQEEKRQEKDAYWSLPARNTQEAFEEETNNEGAKTDVMPYLTLEEKEESPPSSPFVEEPTEDVPDQPSAPFVSAYETLKARFETTSELRKEGFEEDEYNKLAMAIQKSFEEAANNKEAKEDIIPWTMYLPISYGLEEFVQLRKASIEHKPWNEVIPNAALIPPTPIPETRPPPNQGFDAQYQKVIALFECKWNSLLEERKGESRVPLAKKMQKNFETKAADDRAKTERMPWTKYLDRKGVVEQTVFGASEPQKTAVPAIVDEYRDLLFAYPNIPTPALTKDRPPPLQSTWEQPSTRLQLSARRQPSPANKYAPSATKQPVYPPAQIPRYEKDKLYFTNDSPKRSDKFTGMTIPEFAGKIQRAFERTSRDERGKTEKVPWSENLENWYSRAPASEAYDMRPKKEVKKPEPLKLDHEIMERYKLVSGREKVSRPGYPRDLAIRQAEKPTADAQNNSGTRDDAYETEKRTQKKFWDRLCAAVDMGRMDKDWSRHALAFQRDFERRAKDARATIEIMPWSGYLPKEQARPRMASKPTVSADMYRMTRKEEPKTQSHQPRPALVPADIPTVGPPPLHNRSVPAQSVRPADQHAKYQEYKSNAINAWNEKIKKHADMDQVHLAGLAHRFQGVFERQTGRIGYDERSKWEYLPWKYLLPVPSIETEAKRHASTSKPTNTQSHTNDGPARKIAGTKSSPSGGERFIMYEGESEYEREKRYHTWRWGNRIQKVKEGRDHNDWYEHARQFQKSFEKITQDRRAMNESMPWTKKLGNGKDDFGRGMEPRSEKFKENMKREERRGPRQTHR